MNGKNVKKRIKRSYLAIPICTVLGAAFGLIFANIIDHPGFFALGVAIGISMGTAIGETYDNR